MLVGICIAVTALIIAVLVTAYVCYRMAFYESPKKREERKGQIFPEGEIYKPFYPAMEKWARETRQLPQQRFSIRSFDGLTLWGTYFEYAPGAPIELMIHGYRGSAERDLSGGVQRCFRMGRSCFLVDQRCSGESQGHTITFGIREHRDCLSWVDFLISHFGPEVKIILTGVSMGASTVLMAAGNPLPENVLGVLADCGFSSPKAIIQKVTRDMGLPEKLAYPFIWLGARIFGGFNLEELSPLQAMETCRVPVIFFHGEEDDFVPCEMSKQMYEACASRKELVLVPKAGHGLSYPVDPPTYLKKVTDFFGPAGSYQK